MFAPPAGPPVDAARIDYSSVLEEAIAHDEQLLEDPHTPDAIKVVATQELRRLTQVAESALGSLVLNAEVKQNTESSKD